MVELVSFLSGVAATTAGGIALHEYRQLNQRHSTLKAVHAEIGMNLASVREEINRFTEPNDARELKFTYQTRAYDMLRERFPNVFLKIVSSYPDVESAYIATRRLKSSYKAISESPAGSIAKDQDVVSSLTESVDEIEAGLDEFERMLYDTRQYKLFHARWIDTDANSN